MSQAVKRACDACHRRKVKCDGHNPCRNCGTAQLSCTYNAIPQKKGPKGSRAKVISELREHQRQTSLVVKVQNRMNGIVEHSASESQTPGLLTGDIVRSCVDFFFKYVHSQMPFLDRAQIEQQIPHMEKNRDTYCLLSSLCAFTALQPGMVIPGMHELDGQQMGVPGGHNIVAAALLLEDTLRVRKTHDVLDSISFNTLATNFFILAYHHVQEMHDKAWFYLREATTLIHIINMGDEDSLRKLGAGEASRQRRLYWLFYIHERAYALTRHRPMTLQATINPPALGDDPADACNTNLDGFMMLAELYRPINDSFLAEWNQARGNISARLITPLLKQLPEVLQQHLMQDSRATDFHINQAWINDLLWQLNSGSMNGDGDNTMFQYGANAAREQVLVMASCFPNSSVSLIEKLLKACSDAMTLLSKTPSTSNPYGFRPSDNLDQLLAIIAITRRGEYGFLPLLITRVSEILPQLAKPLLPVAPETVNYAEMDIFDGFGNAGMAQVPQQMQMPMDTMDFDHKFSAEEYDRQFMNGNTPDSMGTSSSTQTTPACLPQHTLPQNTEMNNSFLSSPNLMSPGMDFSHSMNNFGLTPLPEGMNSLGNPGQANTMSQMQGQHQSHMTQDALLDLSPPNMNQTTLMYSMRQQQPQQNGFQLQRQTSARTMGNFDLQANNLNAASIGGLTMDFHQLQ